MDVLHDGWALTLRPSHPLCAQPPQYRGAPAHTASTAVLLPVDASCVCMYMAVPPTAPNDRQPMQEVPLDLSRPMLLETVAQLLGGAPWHVLVHGKVGRRGVQPVPQQDEAHPAPMERPFLYSLPPVGREEAPCNARASWIVGM